MIFSKIYKNLNKKNKENLIYSLVLGLVGGLAGGLVWGLAGGLVWGLFGGLFWGLAGGLFGGLFGGLVGGLVGSLFGGLVWGLAVILINLTEALPFINGTLPILGLIFGLIILVEIFFWLSPKEKVTKEDIIKHTLLRKGEALLEVLIIFSAITQIYILTREIDFIKYFPEILKWVGYIGLGLIGIGIICLIGYTFIKLNSLKYSK